MVSRGLRRKSTGNPGSNYSHRAIHAMGMEGFRISMEAELFFIHALGEDVDDPERVARNRAITDAACARRTRRDHKAVHSCDEIPDEYIAPIDEMVAEETRAALHRALHEVVKSPIDKAIIRFTRDNPRDLSWREMADLLGMPESSLRYHRNKLMKALRLSIEGEG